MFELSAQVSFSSRHLQHAGNLWSATWNAISDSQYRPAHRQFDNYLHSSKIEEEEVTLKLILPNLSGKWAFLLNSIVLPKHQIVELQFATVVHDIRLHWEVFTDQISDRKGLRIGQISWCGGPSFVEKIILPHQKPPWFWYWLSATGDRGAPPEKQLSPPKIFKNNRKNGLLSFAPFKFFSGTKPGSPKTAFAPLKFSKKQQKQWPILSFAPP